jgi:hypothetical protein
MPGKDADDQKTNDVYSTERADMKAAGVNVIDRLMASNHIGHNRIVPMGGEWLSVRQL